MLTILLFQGWNGNFYNYISFIHIFKVNHILLAFDRHRLLSVDRMSNLICNFVEILENCITATLTSALFLENQYSCHYNSVLSISIRTNFSIKVLIMVRYQNVFLEMTYKLRTKSTSKIHLQVSPTYSYRLYFPYNE